jgi:catechol 2,3-dioxygenase-like lactoylglutathione lyase family enzyme
MGTTSPVPAKLGAIHHVAFRCRDAEQTRWFYEDVLGLKAAAGIVAEEIPGSRAKIPYMHIFFELGDGNYIAFFDAPDTAKAEWFERKDSFDMHVAIQVETEAEMLAMRDRIRANGIGCSIALDHHFVRSVYMYDPNGIQVEITVRTPDHDAVLAAEGAALPDMLKAWTARTREVKAAKFGAEALDQRGAAPLEGKA